MKKIIKILVILILIQIINIPNVNAGYLDEVIRDGDKFISDGREGRKQDSEYAVDDSTLKDTTDQIYNSLLAIGIGLAVILGAILGIQIMWGSIEQQVKAKEMLMPYVAGCSVVFGAFGIWRICVTIFSQL